MADIIDVQMFTTQLQRELADNITPELKKVTDISKELNKAIIEGNIDVAVETVGSDKVKEISRDLNASNAYFEKTIESANYIAEQFAGIEDHTIAINKVQGLTEQTNQRIANIQKDIKKQEEEIIPTIQSKVHQAELQLSLMKTTDANYKQQQDIVKSLQLTLEQANNSTANMIGQEQGLLHLRDNQLKILEQQLGTGRATSAVIKEHLANGQKIISNAKKQLDLNVDIQKTLNGMNDAQKKLLEDNKDLILETIGGFDSIKDSMMGAFDELPLVGGLLKSQIKGPLEEAAKTAKTTFVQSFIAAKEAAHNTGSSVAGIGAGMKEFTKGIGGMGKAFIGALLSPLSIGLVLVGGLLFLLKRGFDEISRLQEAGRDFRKELGLSANESARLRDNAESLEKQYYSMGLRVEDFYNAQTALADVFSSTDHITKSQTETIALMEKSLGISATTTASAMNNMMKLGATGRGEAAQLTMQMKNLATKYGVAFSKVMEDIASAGEDALIFTRGSAKALAEGAVHARRLGSSIEDVASAAESLLDFESSISSEMEASTMFGRHINMNSLRAAAMAGDTNAMLQERHKIMDDLGGLENMSRWQQKALADAMGTSVEELMNMNKTREQEQMLQNAAARNEEWAIKALARRNKQLEKNNLSAEEQLRLLEEENQRTETMEALTNKLQGAWYKVVVALAPFAEKVMETLVEVMQEFTGSADQAKLATDKLDLDGLKTTVTSLANTVIWMGEKIVWALTHPVEALGLLVAGFIGLKLVMAAISGLSTGIFTKIKNAITGVGDAVQTTTPRRGGILDSVKRFINGLKPTNALAVAASMLILSGAIWVTAKAFQEFQKVDWKTAILGVGVMAALAGMATLLKSASQNMLIGSLAVAALGVALIPAAYAFDMFGGISWSDVIAGGIAIGIIAAAIFGFGSILMSGVGGIIFGLGVVGLTALGAALIPLAYAADLASPALTSLGNILENVANVIGNTLVRIVEGIGSIVKIIGEVLVNTIGAASIGFDMFSESLIKLSSIGIGGLMGVAGGITAIAGAMTLFGAGSAAGGIGNAIGAVGNSIAGFFGGDTRDPIEKLIDSFERLSGIDADSLKTISNFNFDFLQSIPENVDDKLAGLSNELPEFFKALSAVDTSVAVNMSKIGPGLTVMLKGLSVSLPKIKSSNATTLGKLADGMSEFFDSLGDMDTKLIKEMPNINVALGGIGVSLSDIDVIPGNVDEILERVGDGIYEFFDELEGFETEPLDQLGTIKQRLSPFIVDFASLPLSNIQSNVGDILNDLGYGVHEFFDELAGFKEDALVKLPGITVSLVPFVDSMSKVKLPSEDIDSVLKSMGNGLEEFADYIDDGEGASINKFFKQTGTQFVDFVKNLSMITNVSDISVVDKVKELSLLSGTFTKEASDRFREFAYTFVESVDILSQVKDSPLDTLGAVNVDKVKEISSLYSAVDGTKVKELFSMFEAFSSASADKLTEFSYRFVDSMNTIAEIKDPVVDSLNAINTELYKLCETISKLDTRKLEQLKNISSISQTSETNTKTFAERMQTFKNMVHGKDVTYQLNQNTTDNLTKSSNTSVGIQSNTKLDALDSIKKAKLIDTVEKQHLDSFIAKTGGVENFNKLIKLERIYDQAWTNANNFGKKYGTYNEMSEYDASESSYTFTDKSMQAKYQELNKIKKEKLSAYSDQERVMKDEFLRHHKYTYSKLGGYNKFTNEFYKQSDHWQDVATKSLEATNTLPKQNTQTNQQFISDVNGKDKSMQYQNTINSGDIDKKTPTNKQSMLLDIKMNQLEASLQQQNQNQIESSTTNRLISATTPVTDSGSLYTNNRMQEKFEFDSTNRISDIETSKSDLGQIDSIHIHPQNIFIEEIAKVGKASSETQTQTKVDNKEVVSKLDELIALMRRGGISVNMDGKKVSKAVASAHDF